ncbi:PTS fructose transporter subunit IIB [Aeromonas sp. 164P]
MKILAVTSCPSGVANTFMAAESLEMAAQELGWDIKVETQGALGIENEIDAADLASADVVILTNNVKIQGEERFAQLPVLQISVTQAIRNADEIMLMAAEQVAKA